MTAVQVSGHRVVDFLHRAKVGVGSWPATVPTLSLAKFAPEPDDSPHPTLRVRPSDIPIDFPHADAHPLRSYITQDRALSAGQIGTIITQLSLIEELPLNGAIPASTTRFSDYRSHGWPRDMAISGYTLVDAGDRSHGYRSLFHLLRTCGSDEVRGRLTTALFHPNAFDHFADSDCWRSPPSRYLIVDGQLRESPQLWNHFQLDSLGLVPWVFYRLGNEGLLDLPRLSWVLAKKGAQFESQESILVVWLKALHHMRFAEQADFGMWEDFRLPCRGSSIGACTAAFYEAQQFFKTHGISALPHCSGSELEETLQRGYEAGRRALDRRIPLDGSGACETEKFPADAALSINLLADPGLTHAQQDGIIRTLYTHRMQPLGFSRRDSDAYMGQDHPHRKESQGVWGDLQVPGFRPALWGLFDNLIGDFLTRRGIITGSMADVLLGERHLRRSLCFLTPSEDCYIRQSDRSTIDIPQLSVTEAYWWCSQTQRYRPNCNTPLLMGVGALARQLKSAWTARALIEEGQFGLTRTPTP